MTFLPAQSDAGRRVADARRELRLALSLRSLPPRVAIFWWRARRHARRTHDRFSLTSAARPTDVEGLLRLAHDCTAVVELGTGTAWSATALALDNGARRVISYDPCVRSERESYLGLVDVEVRERIDLRDEPDSTGPRHGDPPVQMLFIDSTHEREPVIAAFEAWRDALAPCAIVAFHDFDHPRWPGVREAVTSLQLRGQTIGGMFVWRAP
jgi:predicted O-methyltransferase YrrM